MLQPLDKATALENIPLDFSTYSKLSKELKLDVDIVRLTLQKTGCYCINQIPKVVFEDRSLALLALSKRIPFDKLPEIYKGDKEMVLMDYKSRKYGPIHASLDLWNDKDFTEQAIDLHVSLQYFPPSLRDDREIVARVLSYAGANIQYASDRLKNDDELILLASSNSAIFSCTAPRELSKELCLEIIHRQGKKNRDIPSYLKMDRDVVKAHLTYFTDYSFFIHVDKSFTADEEMVTLVLGRNIEQWKFIDESLKKNEEFMTKILSINPSIYKFLPSDMRNIKQVALKAMKDGKNLNLTNEKLKGDKDIVMEAVSNVGQSIRYASKELRQDKDVLEAALKNDENGVTFVLSKLLDEERLVGTWRFQFCVGEHSNYNHDLRIYDLVLKADYSYLEMNQDICEDYDGGYPRTRDSKNTGVWKIGQYNGIDALYLDENALMSIAMLNECEPYYNKGCEQFNEDAENHVYSKDRKTFSFADGVWSERL